MRAGEWTEQAQGLINRLIINNNALSLLKACWWWTRSFQNNDADKTLSADGW
jgi:hypothetical protein